MRICSGKTISGKVASLLLAATLVAPVAMTGSAIHAQQVYDSYGHQNREWSSESPYYSQWERETHRRHERYERRKREEQREYWEWRHRHDRDHYRDRYRDRDDDHGYDRH